MAKNLRLGTPEFNDEIVQFIKSKLGKSWHVAIKTYSAFSPGGKHTITILVRPYTDKDKKTEDMMRRIKELGPPL